jgi:putative endonuclease
MHEKARRSRGRKDGFMMREEQGSTKYSEADAGEADAARARVRDTRDTSSCWFLYLLECSDGSIYTGVAVDVAARYAAHLRGKGARYTRSHPPRRLLLVLPYPDRSAALRAEHAMKRLSRADKRSRCLRCDGLWRLRGINAAPAPDR